MNTIKALFTLAVFGFLVVYLFVQLDTYVEGREKQVQEKYTTINNIDV